MYIFYDSEATGLNREFCQVLQLAFIHADADLNVIAEKDVSARCNPWVVPSPGALLITGLTPDDLQKPQHSHFGMMQAADGWLRARDWPVTFIGYNTMNFDEDVLRQAFYQTLHDPYLTSGRKEPAADPNTRADLLKIVKAASVYMPGALTLDIKNEYGTTSLSLGNVCRQNGISLGEDDAHDAMADTRATLDLARVVRKAAPAVWDHMMTLSSKEGVSDFLDQNRVFYFTDHAFGRADSRPMTLLSSYNGTQSVLCDLSQDPAPLLNKSVEDFVTILTARGEERFGQPLRTVGRNKQPIVVPLDMADPVRPPELDDATLAARAELVAADAGFQGRLKQALAKAFPPMKPGNEPERKIYEFAIPEARGDLGRWMRQFRDGDWGQRVDLINDFPRRFAEPLKKQPSLARFADFGLRVVFSEAPGQLSDGQKMAMTRFVAERALDSSADAPWMTIARARAEMSGIADERAAGVQKWQHVTDGDMTRLKDFYDRLEKDIRQAAGLPSAPAADPSSPDMGKGPSGGEKGPQPPVWR